MDEKMMSKSESAAAAILVDFNLYFTGMCSFVSMGDEAMIFLPDAREDKTNPNHVPHYAVMEFFMSQVFQAKRAIDVQFPAKGSGILTGVCLLDGEDISIDGAVSHSLEIPDGTHGSCFNGSPSDWLSWVAPLELASPGSGHIDPKCLKAWADVHDTAARLTVTEGKLAVTSFSIGVSPAKLIKWNFEKQDGTVTYKQALGDTVRITWQIGIASTVTIRDANSAKSLTFQASGLPSIDVYIKNLPFDDILGIRPNPLPPGREDHFMHHYRLSSNSSPTVVIPVYEGEFCPEQPPNVGNPKCPPALFLA